MQGEFVLQYAIVKERIFSRNDRKAKSISKRQVSLEGTLNAI